MKKRYMQPQAEVLTLEIEGDILANSFIKVEGETNQPFDSPERSEEDYWSTSWEDADDEF